MNMYEQWCVALSNVSSSFFFTVKKPNVGIIFSTEVITPDRYFSVRIKGDISSV